MTHDSTSLRVFRINELARIIASQLVLISRRSATNLACTCRCLEEPALSALWEVQESFSILLKVFPETDWCVGSPAGGRIVRGLGLPARYRTLKLMAISVLDRRGSITKELEQSPALRVVDAPGHLGSVVGP